MSSAVAFCFGGGALREAARRYNIPLGTLSRRVHGIVKMGCKLGLEPVLSAAIEDRLVSYIVEMSDMGFGPS